MALDDILYATTGSYSIPSYIMYLPFNGESGSLASIEAQTVMFEKRIFGKENKSIF